MTTISAVPPKPSRDDAGRSVVAAALRAEMARHNISGRALADVLGRNPQWVQHRTAGKVPIGSDDIRPIAAAFGISPQELAQRLFSDLEPLDVIDD